MPLKGFISIFLFICFFYQISYAGDGIRQRRYFPELKDYKILQLSKIDSQHVLAFTSKGILLEWQGKKWKQFEPQPPLYIGGNLIALSANNIWRFYTEKEHIYCTKCVHFDGQGWKEVRLTQPYQLGTFSFIDSTRFWASGGWGSLIFYNGERSKNIRMPVGNGVTWIKAFSEKSAIMLINTTNKPKTMDLYEYAKGNWKKLIHWKDYFTMVEFFTPDSFIFVSGDNILYKYGRAGPQVLDTLGRRSINYNHIFDNCIYYYADNWVWRYKYPKKERIIKIKEMRRFLHLTGQNYLLIKEDGSLQFYGDKKYGTLMRQNKQGFLRQDIARSSASRQLGLACYKNKKNETEIYFSSPELENWFLNISSSLRQDCHFYFKNVLLERNLSGYSLGNGTEEALWDGSLLFADLDNDNDRDAVITSLRGYTQLFENMGNDHFENVTKIYDFKLLGRLQEVSVCDLNNDGWLDILAGEEIGPLHIFLNKGYWRFEDITYRVGFKDSLKGYKTAVADMNNDGFPDLFLFGNYDRVRYFENTGQKGIPRFIEKSSDSPELTSRFDFFTRSISFADFDIDGDLDFLLVNRRSPLKLFENIDGHYFIDVSADKGFNQSFLCYGAAWGDLDMDGWQDIFLTTLGKNYIFWNKKGRYFKIDSLSIPKNKLEYSTACLIEDLDDNGVLDIVVANYEIGSSHFLYNTLIDSSYIKIVLKAQKNSSVIGAHVELYESGFLGDKRHLRGFQEIRNQNGYCSGVLPLAYFAVDSAKLYEARIHFPSGKVADKKNLIANNTYLFQEPAHVSEKINNQFSAFASLIFNVRYRKIVFQILLVLITIIFVNYYIYKYTIWQKHHLLFYDAFLAIIYSALSFYFLESALWSRFLIPAYVSVVVGIFLFLLINRYTKLQYQDEREFELFDVLRQFHHSHVGMNTIDHLIFYASNYKDKNLLKEFNGEVDFYLNNTDPLLMRIAFFGLKLLKQRKTLNRLKRNHGRILTLLNSGKDIKNPSALKNSLTELKKDISAIRRSVDSLFTSSLVGCVNEALHNFTQFSKVSLINQTGLTEIYVVTKHGDLIQVLDNILQNAIEAMRDKRDKNLNITIEHADSEHIRMIIQDYGGGIKREVLSKIFNEHFSTKNSSGLGLFHAKKLLTRYGSDIVLAENKAKRGAAFELLFRTHRNEET